MDNSSRLAPAHHTDAQLRRNGIAVVGMAGRFPGAPTVEKLWENLVEGRVSIVSLDDDDLEDAGINEATKNRPDYVRAAALIDDIDMFDAERFRLSAGEAAIMDPQHRVFLECVGTALDDAGHDPKRLAGSIGLYAGCSMSSYLISNLLPNAGFIQDTGVFETALANDKDYLTARAAYHYDLRGPCVGVQTACSTSLTAVHLACQSLLSGECDMALAGGITLRVPQKAGYVHNPGSILSRSGRCRPFDVTADGTVFGNGVGIVVLRRLEDAWADGDRILAVIAGTSLVNEGADKAGLTAPSAAAQARVIAEAQAMAGVTPADIGLVETHGTGTALGDPIELSALADVFLHGDRRPGGCAIGTAKANVGHLDVASGVTGLIKACLAVHHGIIPPSRHFSQPGSAVTTFLAPFPRAPFFINTEPEHWVEDSGMPRRAGVSSFGIGGSNVHVVLEQAPERGQVRRASRSVQVLLLSGHTPQALEAATANLRDDLAHSRAETISDVAYTLQQGRARLAYRRMLVARSLPEAIAGLGDLLLPQAIATAEPATEKPDFRNRAIILAFTNLGREYRQYGRAFYDEEPGFRAYFDICRQAFLDISGVDCLDQPAGAEQPGTATYGAFAFQYALGRLLIDRIGSPAGLVGFGLGELVASVISGAIDLDTAAEFLKSPLSGPAQISLPNTAKIPLLSGKTGVWTTVEEPLSAHRYDLETSDHNRALQAIREADLAVIEVGTEDGFVNSAKRLDLPAITCLSKSTDSVRSFNNVLGQLWLDGHDVDWFTADVDMRRVALSPSALLRKRHWIDPPGDRPVDDHRPCFAAERVSPTTQPLLHQPASSPSGLAALVTGIWEEVLGTAPISSDDDFFDLGGHSLLAVKVVARLRAALPVEIPLDIFFEATTVATLAERLEAHLQTAIDQMSDEEAEKLAAVFADADGMEDLQP
ncbi:acyl transferase domain-containing protein [Neorhizobium huautlense]|uniref:Acyl transferase domain-containing protein n=1 Tax=Neorhizobium huautlense TaxID=67774 RepID=A0ABT9PV82_9HYPH|nr:beta-ketoacyl synthase N-terminal-like domain-containing protein [Neorhizobium huautlense]MDP9838379.1 acyl transferase domain-containing protein [Neorhizobium huautlense]